MSDVGMRCECGLVRGTASDVGPQRGNRAICYCDDCQAYAAFLGKADMVDAHGGTDIYQLAPAQLTITEGVDQLRCVRLSPKGLMRWYAGCCNTPVGNTLSPKVPFIGVPHLFMDHAGDGRSRDQLLGPPLARVQARYAKGRPAGAHPRWPLGLLARSVRLLLLAKLTGKTRPSPFFDPKTDAPIVEPHVLPLTQRRALTPAAQA